MTTTRRLLAVLGIMLAMVGGASAAIWTHTGPFGFSPIAGSADTAAWDPAEPWVIPEGFVQYQVANETDLNVYDGGRDDLHDMNTVNETGKHAGRYLYTTHEVRGVPEGGSVTVVDQWTGEVRVIAQDPSWNALDGIVWTPWRTVLFAEEVAGGRLFELELDPHDMMSGTVHERPAVGALAHEGIGIGPRGELYVVDEHRGLTQGCAFKPCGGGIYKFVPKRYGDLSQGDLYALAIDGDAEEGLGQGSWVGPIDPADARVAGSLLGAQSYQRPEDIEVIGHDVYVAITEGTVENGSQRYDGRVIQIDLRSMQVTDYVRPGLNVPVEANGESGLDNPDNLARTPDGKLVIVEDNVPSDIWIAAPDRNRDGSADDVALFASLSDPGAEGTGIYFGKDPKLMYVNVQHSAAPDGDATWAIEKVGKLHKLLSWFGQLLD